jgi:hypothetical protein
MNNNSVKMATSTPTQISQMPQASPPVSWTSIFVIISLVVLMIVIIALLYQYFVLKYEVNSNMYSIIHQMNRINDANSNINHIQDQNIKKLDDNLNTLHNKKCKT